MTKTKKVTRLLEHESSMIAKTEIGMFVSVLVCKTIYFLLALTLEQFLLLLQNMLTAKF